jgi:hypothetical protein
LTVAQPGATVVVNWESTMAKHIIDASRAGEVLDDFLRQWKFDLTDDIAGTVLEFKLNREVDALCRRLANNPEVDVKSLPGGVRALLAGRILLFLANSVEEPDAEILAGEGIWTDEAIHAGVWNLPRPGCPASGMASRSIRGRVSKPERLPS